MFSKLGRSPLTYLLGGFAVSACAIGLCGLFAVGILSLRQPPPAASSAAVPTAPPTIPQREAATSTPPPLNNPILQQAEQLLLGGEAQRAVELLKEHLAEFAEPFEKAQAYELLGRAEMELGYFQFAASHFNQAYALTPSDERLFNLGLAYDLGGNLEEALKAYEALLAKPRVEAELRRIAEQRTQELRKVLGTAVPNGL